MRRKKTLDERMNEGGPVFWLACILGAVGFYGALWLMMALGTMAGF
jgi:hypothetical protein